MNTIKRCPWCGDDPLYVRYHDEEWGVPMHDDIKLFEFLTLEGAQAGLSWITVLRKRENYREHFHEWDIEKIANMRDEDLEAILLDPGIIRNRLKVYSVRKNAIVALQIQKEFGSLDAYFWDSRWLRHVEGSDNGIETSCSENRAGFLVPRNDRHNRTQAFPLIHHGATMYDFPTEDDISRAISKDLKKRGMSFVGSTIIYAFMQAVGMVDDHIESCFRKGKR